MTAIFFVSNTPYLTQIISDFVTQEGELLNSSSSDSALTSFSFTSSNSTPSLIAIILKNNTLSTKIRPKLKPTLSKEDLEQTKTNASFRSA